MNVDIRNFSERTAILKAIHRGIDRYNRTNLDHPKLDTAPNTPLFGNGSALDSLGIINLIHIVEQEVKSAMGLDIVLVEDILTMDEHPLSTIQSLADHTERVVAKKRQAMQARD